MQILDLALCKFSVCVFEYIYIYIQSGLEIVILVFINFRVKCIVYFKKIQPSMTMPSLTVRFFVQIRYCYI